MVLRTEVREAIHAVQKFADLEPKRPNMLPTPTIAEVNTIMEHGPVSDEQAQSILIMLRAVWTVSVDSFCGRFTVKFQLGTVTPSCRLMFEEAKLQQRDRVIGPGQLQTADVETVRKWLINDLRSQDWTSVNDALVRQLFQLICPGGTKVYLDE